MAVCGITSCGFCSSKLITTGIHARDQQEPRWISQRHRGTRDRDVSILERLPEHLEHVARPILQHSVRTIAETRSPTAT
jgi:hypothetical protein